MALPEHDHRRPYEITRGATLFREVIADMAQVVEVEGTLGALAPAAACRTPAGGDLKETLCSGTAR